MQGKKNCTFFEIFFQARVKNEPILRLFRKKFFLTDCKSAR